MAATPVQPTASNTKSEIQISHWCWNVHLYCVVFCCVVLCCVNVNEYRGYRLPIIDTSVEWTIYQLIDAEHLIIYTFLFRSNYMFTPSFFYGSFIFGIYSWAAFGTASSKRIGKKERWVASFGLFRIEQAAKQIFSGKMKDDNKLHHRVQLVSYYIKIWQTTKRDKRKRVK